MKKLLILAIAIGLGICLTVGLIFAAMQHQPKADSWSTESPRKTYLVRFSGIASAPSWPFTEPADLRNRKVTINVSRNGKVILDRAEVYDGDAYQEPKWKLVRRTRTRNGQYFGYDWKANKSLVGVLVVFYKSIDDAANQQSWML